MSYGSWIGRQALLQLALPGKPLVRWYPFLYRQSLLLPSSFLPPQSLSQAKPQANRDCKDGNGGIICRSFCGENSWPTEKDTFKITSVWCSQNIQISMKRYQRISFWIYIWAPGMHLFLYHVIWIFSYPWNLNRITSKIPILQCGGSSTAKRPVISSILNCLFLPDSHVQGTISVFHWRNSKVKFNPSLGFLQWSTHRELGMNNEDFSEHFRKKDSTYPPVSYIRNHIKRPLSDCPLDGSKLPMTFLPLITDAQTLLCPTLFVAVMLLLQSSDLIQYKQTDKM